MTKVYKNYIPLPNAIFSLNLCPGEIAVYSYLLYCEDRKTYQCYLAGKLSEKDALKVIREDFVNRDKM